MRIILDASHFKTLVSGGTVAVCSPPCGDSACLLIRRGDPVEIALDHDIAVDAMLEAIGDVIAGLGGPGPDILPIQSAQAHPGQQPSAGGSPS